MIGEEVCSRDRVMYFVDGVREEYRSVGVVDLLYIQSELPDYETILPLFMRKEQ